MLHIAGPCMQCAQEPLCHECLSAEHQCRPDWQCRAPPSPPPEEPPLSPPEAAAKCAQLCEYCNNWKCELPLDHAILGVEQHTCGCTPTDCASSVPASELSLPVPFLKPITRESSRSSGIKAGKTKPNEDQADVGCEADAGSAENAPPYPGASSSSAPGALAAELLVRHANDADTAGVPSRSAAPGEPELSAASNESQEARGTYQPMRYLEHYPEAGYTPDAS